MTSRVAAAVLALALAACSPAETLDTAARSVAVAPFTAEVAFPRTLQAARNVELQLSLDVAPQVDVVVVGASLDSSLFDDVGWQEAHVRVFEGWLTRVRLALGAAACEPDGTSAANAPDAVAHVAFDVSGVEVIRDVTVPAGVLEGIHAEECAMRELTDLAAPVLGGPDATDGLTVTTSLSLVRGVGEASRVDVTAVAGSVVFDLEADSLPVSLVEGDESVSTSVRITPTRCDPHVFAESKKTFVFAVWLAVAGAEPVHVEVRPGPDLEEALQAAFDACAQL